MGGGRAPRGVGFCGVWAGSALSSWHWRPVVVVSMAVWGSCRRCGTTLSSLPPLPSPHDIVYCCGRGVSRATMRSGGSGFSVVVCGVVMWAAVAPTVVRVPADLVRRSGCCQGWPTGGAVVQRVVLPLLGRDRGPNRRWCQSALLCDCCGNDTSLALCMGLCGLVGRRRLWRCALSPGPGRTLCWEGFLGESLSGDDVPGRRFPC